MFMCQYERISIEYVIIYFIEIFVTYYFWNVEG